jgi:UDP-3-O-[3-hydroxymyristoyl] N-acetylglucosamine deacetylase
MQTTINNTIEISGVGLHSGKISNLKIIPAPKNHGIVFVRKDIKKQPKIKAIWSNVTETLLSTSITSSDYSVRTVEHLMAAIYSLNIHNLLIEISGEEMPILDGSSAIFCDKLKKAGIKELQNSEKLSLVITKEIEITNNNFSIKVNPNKDFIINFTIDFPETFISNQKFSFNFTKSNFCKHLAKARTFTRLQDVELLKSKGLALGGSLENAVVIDKNRVLNKEGLRYKEELVRHKILDCIGDISLSGYHNIKGEFTCYKSGHLANNLILREIFKDNNNYEISHSSQHDLQTKDNNFNQHVVVVNKSSCLINI